LLLGAWLAGCHSFGPRTVPGDRFDYNAAIARSHNEQMLLNLVRMRYLQMPNFLTVSSVIAGYTYQGGIGVSGQRALGSFDEDLVGGSANLNYTERPTITYTPLDGQAFSRRLLKTIPIDVLFAVAQSGWPSDVLFRIEVQRIGETENMAFGMNNIGESGFREEAEKLELYDRVIQIMQRLDARGAFEVVRVGDDEVATFRFARSMSPELKVLADELKDHLGLEPDRNAFEVTDHITARGSHEILIQTRSLLAILSFLARGVEVPEEDSVANRVLALPPDVVQVIEEQGPLRVRVQKKRPDDPFAAVRYRDHWFYVDGADHLSKRTFGTVLVLFELLAPGGGGAAPLLTLPAG
jgi:hypothetical protein